MTGTVNPYSGQMQYSPEDREILIEILSDPSSEGWKDVHKLTTAELGLLESLCVLVGALREASAALATYNREEPEFVVVPHDELILKNMQEEFLPAIDPLCKAMVKVKDNPPVSATTRKGKLWRRPTIPISFLSTVRIARESDQECLPFSEQAAVNQEVYLNRLNEELAKKEQYKQASCARGQDRQCKAKVVYWPGKRTSDLSCHWHISGKEATQLSDFYKSAQAEIECRSCGAQPTKRCAFGYQKPVDGVTTQLRQFRGVKVHECRLDDYYKQTKEKKGLKVRESKGRKQ